MKLSQTDKKLLISAISNNKPKFLMGRVHASSLESKRKFNSLMKLCKMGLVDGKCSYQHMNGYQDPYFGRLWCEGKSWNEFSGSLTAKGLEIARSLII